jgi:hypothetical protein
MYDQEEHKNTLEKLRKQKSEYKRKAMELEDERNGGRCKCSCDGHMSSFLCCSLGCASVFATFVRLLFNFAPSGVRVFF